MPIGQTTQTHSIVTVNILKKTPPSSGRDKIPFVLQIT